MPTGRAGSATPPSTGSGSCCSRASPRSTSRRCRSRPPKWRCCASSTPPSCPIPARCSRSWRAARSRPRPPPRRRRRESQGALLQAPAELPGAGRAARRQAARPHLAQQLHDYRRPGPLRAARAGGPAARSRSPAISSATLRAALKALTGTAVAGRARPTSEAAADPARAGEGATPSALRQEVLDSPLVKAAFEAFPEAELAGYTIDEQRSA